jgi:hypothetical protein
MIKKKIIIKVNTYFTLQHNKITHICQAIFYKSSNQMDYYITLN